VEKVIKPLTPLPFYGSRSKNPPDVKLMHYTIICSIFISQILVSDMGVLMTLTVLIELNRKDTGSLILCGSYSPNMQCLDITSALSAICSSDHITC
jgi:hypothetical protein